MARTYLVFGDIEGKLDVLRVECTKCSRKGRYRVHKLIEKYGRKANMMKWKEQLNGDCGSVNVRFAPKATEVLRCRELARCAITGRERSQQKPVLLNHLVGDGEYAWRNCKA